MDLPESPLLLEPFSHQTPLGIFEKSAHLGNYAVDVVLRLVFVMLLFSSW